MIHHKNYVLCLWSGLCRWKHWLEICRKTETLEIDKVSLEKLRCVVKSRFNCTTTTTTQHPFQFLSQSPTTQTCAFTQNGSFPPPENSSHKVTHFLPDLNEAKKKGFFVLLSIFVPGQTRVKPCNESKSSSLFLLLCTLLTVQLQYSRTPIYAVRCKDGGCTVLQEADCKKKLHSSKCQQPKQFSITVRTGVASYFGVPL